MAYRLAKRAEADSYVRKASHVTVRHRHGKVVAVIEIISPGNKASRRWEDALGRAVGARSDDPPRGHDQLAP